MPINSIKIINLAHNVPKKKKKKEALAKQMSNS